MQPDPALPICVDLDGTLLATDSLAEALVQLLRTRPWLLLLVPVWLMRGRACLKARIAEVCDLDIASLPVHPAVLDWLRERHTAGANLWLCTGAPLAFAERAARHFGFFAGVLATEGELNLTGSSKADILARRFGERGFVYCGNETRDLAVWSRAAGAVVAGSDALAAQASQKTRLVTHFSVARPGARDFARALRVHQWAKNLLLFVPLLAAHEVFAPSAWQHALPAFVAFCLTASAFYLFNDLIDLPSDRAHPLKRRRPFASGRLPLIAGLMAAPLLLIVAAIIATALPPRFGLLLAVYAVTTLAYSFWLKRVALVDAWLLAALYTLRIIAGAAAIRVPLSFWLMAFSGFLFLSLALVKRSAEMRLPSSNEDSLLPGRGYRRSDRALVDAIGVVAGLQSVLVLALYINSPEVSALYGHPPLLWGLCPLLTWWICRVWLLVHRGEMHEDPVVFALRDRASLVGVLLAGLLVWIAT